MQTLWQDLCYSSFILARVRTMHMDPMIVLGYE